MDTSTMLVNARGSGTVGAWFCHMLVSGGQPLGKRRVLKRTACFIGAIYTVGRQTHPNKKYQGS